MVLVVVLYISQTGLKYLLISSMYSDELILTRIAFCICFGYRGLTWQSHSLHSIGCCESHGCFLFRREMYVFCNDSGQNVV